MKFCFAQCTINCPGFYDFGANPKFNMSTKANNAIWLGGPKSFIFYTTMWLEIWFVVDESRMILYKVCM
jgi:hypothetical protein